MNQVYDIVIVGGGLVGLSFALALKDSPLNIALVEKKPPEHFDLNQHFYDLRVYAISNANVKFLKNIGIWKNLSDKRVQPVYDMRIFGDSADSELHFSAYEACVPELSFIVENGYLHNVMWQEMLQQSNVTLFQGYDLVDLKVNEQTHAELSLKDHANNQKQVQTKLVVGADGANSWIRNQTHIVPKFKPYQQYGLVANFETEKYHQGYAHQWFTEDSILAYLPLVGKNISIVYSCYEEKMNELFDLYEKNPNAFAQKVSDAGHLQLGHLKLTSELQKFPLRLMTTDTLVHPRVALMGDAGHLVHPLAGQGVNLGFGDAESLAHILSEYSRLADRSSRDVGQLVLLKQYVRDRQEPVLAMQTVTDLLQKLFNNPNRVLKSLRNFGLNLTNQHRVLKNLLIRNAMG